MQHLPLTDYLKVFFNYCLKPVHRNPMIDDPQYSTKNLIGGFFVLFVGYMLLMSMLSGVLGLEDMDHAFADIQDEMAMWQLFLLAVIVAPILEEGIFRFPLKYFTSNFPILFYIFTIVFAGLHVANFTGSVEYWKMPLLVLPQLILGFYLGFVRMKFSWPHAIGIHMLNNLIPTLMLIASDAMGIDMM